MNYFVIALLVAIVPLYDCGGPPSNDSDSVDEADTDSEEDYERESTTDGPTTRLPTTSTRTTGVPVTRPTSKKPQQGITTTTSANQTSTNTTRTTTSRRDTAIIGNLQPSTVASITERLTTIDVETEGAVPIVSNPRRRLRATQQIESPIVPISHQLMHLSDILYQTAAQMHQLADEAASSSMDEQHMVTSNQYVQTISGALQMTHHVRHLSYNLGEFAQYLPTYIVTQPDGAQEK